MKKQRPVSPDRPVHRITYSQREEQEVVAAPYTAMGTSRSPIRHSKSAFSPLREPSAYVASNFLSSLGLVGSATFASRIAASNWTEDGQEIRDYIIDHSVQVDGSRISKDLRKSLKMTDFLQLMKTLDYSGFDPIFSENNADNVFEYFKREEDFFEKRGNVCVAENAIYYEFVYPQDFELYALSFDAVIDYLKVNEQKALTYTLEQLKCYFLQKLTTTPTRTKALYSAVEALDQQLLLKYRDNEIINYQLRQLTMDSAMQQQRHDRLYAQIVKLQCVISYLESEREGLRMELITKTEHIKVLGREIQNTQSLLSDALARCKRLSNASYKLKMQAERANERYNDAEHIIAAEQRKSLELEYEKTDFQHQAARYKKEFEKLRDMFKEEYDRNAVEFSRLNAKIVYYSQNSGVTFNFNSENLGKICQEACQMLVKLSRFSDAELYAVQLDRDGIGALAYILSSADSAETMEKFLFAIKTDYRPGINKQSQTMLSWYSMDANYNQSTQKLKIYYRLSQLKMEQSDGIEYARLQSQAARRRDIILNQQEKALNAKDAEAYYETINYGTDYGVDYQEAYTDDYITVYKERFAYFGVPPPFPKAYSKQQAYHYEQDDNQLYSKYYMRERKRYHYLEQYELKKMMMDAIEKQKSQGAAKYTLSLLDVLEKHTNDVRTEEVDSDLSENDIIIRPDEFLMMNEDQQMYYIQKFNDYTRERQRKKADDLNLLKSRTESYFSYRNETDFFDNSSGDDTELGTGFLNTMFSNEVLKRKLGKPGSLRDSNTSYSSRALEMQELTVIKKLSDSTDGTVGSSYKLEKQLPSLAKMQMHISRRDSSVDTSTGKRSSSTVDVYRPKSYYDVFRNNGRICCNIGVQTASPSIDALLNAISDRVSRSPEASLRDDAVLQYIGMYMQEHPQLSKQELKVLTQVANSYVVHKVQAKERGWAAPETIYTLENAVKAYLFYEQQEARQIVQYQLAQNEQLQRIHQVIRQRLADYEDVIDPEQFLNTNSLFIANTLKQQSYATEASRRDLIANQQRAYEAADSVREQVMAYYISYPAAQLTQQQRDVVEKQQSFLLAQKYQFVTGYQLNYYYVSQFATDMIAVFDSDTHAVGQARIADIVIPGHEYQQALIQRVIDVAGGVKSGYKHVSSENLDAARQCIIRRRADQGLIASIKEELRRYGFDERILEKKAAELARKKADEQAIADIEKQLLASGKSLVYARAEAQEAFANAAQQLYYQPATTVETISVTTQKQKPQNISGISNAAPYFAQPASVIDTAQIFSNDEFKDIQTIDSEVQEMYNYVVYQNERIRLLQLSVAEHTDKLELSRTTENAPAQTFTAPDVYRLSQSASDSDYAAKLESCGTLTRKTANIVKHLKNSLYKDQKAGGVIASLAKAHVETEMQQRNKNYPTKSIIQLYVPKDKKPLADLQDIDDLEEAFADAKDEQAARYIQSMDTIYYQAEETIGKFVNYQKRYQNVVAVSPEADVNDKYSRFEEFLKFINKKTFDDRYNLPPNTMIYHPINGSCDTYYVEVRKLFGEHYFIITEEQEALRGYYGFRQTLAQFNFYPCILKRGQCNTEWYYDAKMDVKAGGMLNTTYYHYLDRKEAIFYKQQPKSKLCAPTLIPQTGDIVDYIRADSVSIFGNSPHILDYIQNYGQVVLQRVNVREIAYIKVPLFNNQLKSLQWTLRTIRMLWYERYFSSLQLLTLQYREKRVMQTELAEYIESSERVEADRLRLIPGQLSQRGAFSMAEFVCDFAVARYGLRTLVLQLLFALITALAYYYYENDEVYLFARFFFDDVPSDFLLLYLELRKMTRIDVCGDKSAHNDLRAFTFDAEYAPGLANALFPNWDAKRKFVLAEQLLQFSEAVAETPRLRGQASVPQIALSKAAALILSYYSVFRAVTFRNCQFLATHFAASTDSADSSGTVQLPALKQLFDCINVQVDAREFYLALGKPLNLADFDVFFQKYELGRFACIAPATLKGKLDSGLVQEAAKIRQLARTLTLCFQLVGKHCRSKLAKLSGEYTRLRQFLQQRFDLIQSWFKVVESDIRVFDCERSLQGLQRIGQEMVKCLNWEGEGYDIEIAVVETLSEVVKEFVGY